ncbi:tRNA (guanine-N1)-methyltransferase [Winogradskyella sp. A3E31]|uniref:tRNA (guanine-N1)-methyltransferase n=1 Tax=Winogradskyella sp. A3E31 TaxID=3349637 RepID=UPI00398B91C9
MKFVLQTAILLVFTFNVQLTNSQETDTSEKVELKRNEGTIDDQFEYVIDKSYTYRGNGKVYKNVEYHWLTELKATTLDSLKAVHKDLADTKAVVESQASEIESLKSNLSNTKDTLADTNLEKDSMALFGLQMSKTSYNVLLWSIIAGLLALLLFFIFKFKSSNAVTREAKNKLDEVESEFEEHRRTALEREQKVRRQLQDEINKQKS